MSNLSESNKQSLLEYIVDAQKKGISMDIAVDAYNKGISIENFVLITLSKLSHLNTPLLHRLLNQ